MKHILCATDLSHRSDRALRRAFRLAHGHGAKLTLLKVVDCDLPAAVAAAMQQTAHAELARYAADIAAQFPCSYQIRVEPGDATHDIGEIARQDDVDLIALGMHRQRRFMDQVRETTMERIVRASRCPALLVRDTPDHDYAKVLAPVDFAPASTAALHCALRVAPTADVVAFHALHVAFTGLFDDNGATARAYVREATDQMQAWAKAGGLPRGIKAPKIIRGGLTQVLERQLAKHKPDLIAIGAHARAGLAPWLLGSFAAELVRDPPCDLLVARSVSG